MAKMNRENPLTKDSHWLRELKLKYLHSAKSRSQRDSCSKRIVRHTGTAHTSTLTFKQPSLQLYIDFTQLSLQLYIDFTQLSSQLYIDFTQLSSQLYTDLRN